MATKLANSKNAKSVKGSKLSSATKMLLQDSIDFSDKRMLLGQLAHDDSPEAAKAINELLGLASEEVAKDSFVKKQQ